MRLCWVLILFCFAVFSFCNDLQNAIEQGGIGIAFGAMLFFVLQQFRRLMEHLTTVQMKVVGVVEKNTQSNLELKASFDRLSERLAV